MRAMTSLSYAATANCEPCVGKGATIGDLSLGMEDGGEHREHPECQHDQHVPVRVEEPPQ